MVTFSDALVENTLIVPVPVSGSTTATLPKFTVTAPSTKPRPSRRRLLPGVNEVKLNELILGTICNRKLSPVPGMVTSPVTAACGTVTLASVPSMLMLLILLGAVPGTPLSFIVGKIRFVLLLKSVPVTAMVCDALADEMPPSEGVPTLATAAKPVNEVGPKLTVLLTPPSVSTLISPPPPVGMLTFSDELVENTSIVPGPTSGSTIDTPPKLTVIPPSTKPRPLSRMFTPGLKSVFVNEPNSLGTICNRKLSPAPGIVTSPVTAF